MPDKPRVLVVEDNLLISMEVQFLLEQSGCEAVGPAGDCAEALALVQEQHISAAVLDVNLGDERVWPVLEALDAAHLPFILVTGYSREDIPKRYRGRPILSKPLAPDALRAGLTRIGLIEG